MSSYRKRPIAVDARQFTTATMYDVVAWVRDQGGKALEASGLEGPLLIIQTLEGNMTARLDDWIVRGIKGEFHPVRADIFAETYEPVPDGQADTEERIARALAADDYLMPDEEPDEHWWNGRTLKFREDYLAHARRVIAVVRAQEQPAVTRADDRASVLTEEAEHLRTVLYPAVYDDAGQKAADGVSRAAGELRRRARQARRTAGEQSGHTTADATEGTS